MFEPADVSQPSDNQPQEAPAPPLDRDAPGGNGGPAEEGDSEAGAKPESVPLSEDEQRYREVLSFLGSDVRVPGGVPRDYRPQEHSIHPLFRIDLGAFGGPFDLLLYLIRKHSIDVFDIPIRFVTEQYLEMLDTLRALDIDVAAEFLMLAADLVHIKSKMLLPAKEDDPIDDLPEESGDPRADLVRRLLEYQKYRDAAVELSDRDQLGRDVFARQPPLTDEAHDVDPGLKQVSIFKLVELMAGMMKKKPVRHEISYESFSIAERMHFVMRFGMSQGGRFMLVDLMDAVESRAELVVTFIAVLESTKLQLVRLRMDEAAPTRSAAEIFPPEPAPAAGGTLPPAEPTEVSSDPVPTADASSGEAASGGVQSGEAPRDEVASNEVPSGEARSGELPPGEARTSDTPSGEVPSGDGDPEQVAAAPAEPTTPSPSSPEPGAGASLGSMAEAEAILREVVAIEQEMAAQKEEEDALEARRAAPEDAPSAPWREEPLPTIWVELTGKSFEGDIMDDYA